MKKLIFSHYFEKPKYRSTWYSMWLGLGAVVIPPLLSFFIESIRPFVDPASMEGRINHPSISMGFGSVLFSLLLISFAIRSSVKALGLGERSWVVWVGLAPSILIGLFWLLMIAGELSMPH